MINVVLAAFLLVVALLLLFVILTFFFLIFDLFLDLPYVATKRREIETTIKLAQIKKGQTVVDLGSGDGRLLFAAAAGGARAVGYEVNPIFIALTLIHAKLKGLSDQIRVERQSLWRADLKVADVIFVYAFRKSMKRFEDLVYQNAQKGTRVIVNTNPFPTKKPDKSSNGIFLYKI